MTAIRVGPGARKTFAILAIIGVAFTANALAESPAQRLLATSKALNEINLPRTTGAYPVGSTSLHLVDDSRPEIFTDDPDDVREFMVHLWYPAVDASTGERADYMDWWNGHTLAEWLLPGLPDLGSYYFLTATNSAEDVPLATAEDRFPVVLFSPGLGITDRAYTVFFEELASHGFVVAAISHAFFSGYTVFPDGTWVVTAPRPRDDSQAAWLEEHSYIVNQDAAFVLDTLEELDAGDPAGRFTGRLDLANVGMFGHSYGGGNSLDMCLLDSRVDAAVDIDGGSIYHVDEVGTDRPVMFLLTPTRWEWFQTIRDTWQRLRGFGLLVTVEGTTHISFIDNGWLFTQLAGYEVMNDDDWRLGTIDPAVLVQIERAYVLAFFDVHLRGGRILDLLRLHHRFDAVEVQRNSFPVVPAPRRSAGRRLFPRSTGAMR